MSNIVSVAVMALTLPLGSLLVAQTTNNKPAPAKPLPPVSKPVVPAVKPAPTKPAVDEDAAKRRERMQQRDREIDKMLKSKAKQR